ncbi:MAG TPA: hypothetical protein VJ507_02075 [Candidatus Bathyarchaeia archaeon]|nr:hypothetical protein [Candidatus Bathyarchaeia archaeon]
MVVQEILEVFYAPHRAFKKIVNNPKFLAPIIVVIMLIVLQVGSAYIVGTKSHVEQTIPTSQQGDGWTENAALWQASPGVTITNNHFDYINSSNFYYNTTSIEFTAENASSIQIFLTNFGESVNCGLDGFKNLSIRAKIDSLTSIPDNVTLYLFSLSPANFFAYDLTQAFSNTTIAEQHLWNNITVQVGSDDWIISNSAASWETITGLRIDFTWPSSSNLNLRVDGLFFRGIFKGELEIDATGFIIGAALNSATPFLIQWLLLTALMYLVIKMLKGNVVWKPLMVAVGVAMVTLIVQTIVFIAVYAAILPEINSPLELIARIPGEGNAALSVIQNTLAPLYNVAFYVQIAIWAWIFVLGIFITRAVTGMAPPRPADLTQAETEGPVSYPQFNWSKCMMVSFASVVIRVLILLFVGI